MDVPIPFFQAAATAIPTLLIALAVGVKMGNQFATDSPYRLDKLGKATAALLVVATIVSGEFVALAALIEGAGSANQATWVLTSIGTCIYFLGFELLTPLLYGLSRWAGWILSGIAALGLMGGCGAVVLNLPLDPLPTP